MSTTNQNPPEDFPVTPKIVVRLSHQPMGEEFSIRGLAENPLSRFSLEPYLPSAPSIVLLQSTARKHISAVQSRLSRYYSIDVPSGSDAREALSALETLPNVEVAYIDPGPHHPPVAPHDDPHSERQRYLEPSPTGIDAHFAWSLTDGAGVAFVDIEQGWTLDHEDLIGGGIEILSGVNLKFHGHGTAVLGQMCAADNELGCVGIAPGSKASVVSEWRSGGRFNTADAIASAVDVMERGDVLLIEAQTHYGPFSDVPVEVYDATFDSILAACEAGIIVVEAAGNGGIDLDMIVNSRGRNFLRRGVPYFRDSGAILVGAATSSTPRRRSDFSNYGSRVDCFGWGDSVATCGDGWTGTRRDEYTENFRGTSAAAPLVAGAALLLQAWSKATKDERIDPNEMRAWLSNASLNTETHRPSEDRIGVMPDLQRLLEAMSR